jgi:peptide/nickel transport system substrate-binding protein
VKRIASFLTRERHVGPLRLASLATKRFSRSERILFWVVSAILIATVGWALHRVQSYFVTEVPAYGGSLRESSMGVPRFVNPLLAASDADRDMTALVYSGLMRYDESGELVPDLAESYAVSEDGMEYRFTMREGLTFHDGTPVTAYDVEYTIKKAKDPAIKSSRRANWEGVSVEVPSAREIVFRLGQPYPRFLGNTTMGILPQHLWEDVSDDEFPHTLLNTEPIGTGPYVVREIVRSDSGIPTSYELRSFRDFSQGRPYIDAITVSFFANEDEMVAAFEEGEVDSIHGVSAKKAASIAREDATEYASILPRVFGVFFNQAKSVGLSDKSARLALSLATDRDAIIRDVFDGYAQSESLPIMRSEVNRPQAPSSKETALGVFEDFGWTLNADGVRQKKIDGADVLLSFTLTTADVPELVDTAYALKEQWEAVGARVEVKVIDPNDLASQVIRPREFQALLFGQALGHTPDLYAFWHSSQRNDPGLNIVNYANINADKALTGARTAIDKEEQMGYHESFLKEIEADVPAVFLYSPAFAYRVSNAVSGVSLGRLSVPSERFSTIHTWYVETDSVWNVFTNN